MIQTERNTLIKERFKAWWKRSKIDRPLMYIVAKRDDPLPGFFEFGEPKTHEEMYTDADRIFAWKQHFFRTHKLMADALPWLDANFGPGSIALYIGSEPIFARDTVWYEECVNDWATHPDFKVDAKNKWWKMHIEIYKRLKELAKGEFALAIPDLIENVDILSAMRGPMDFCYDLIDEPELIKKFVGQVDDLYFKYYDEMYELVKEPDGSSSFTAFHVWGPGKTAKVQCDFSALMNPAQFREFVVPSLRKQCMQLDNSIFHLDGKDCIKHLDALMEIEELDALQWTAGAGQPDGSSEIWYPVYDKVKAAGKALWVSIDDGGIDDWIKSGDRIVERYGIDGLYLLFGNTMTEAEAEKLITHAERNWH